MGPNTFKKRFRDLYLYMKKGGKNRKMSRKQISKTSEGLLELADQYNENIHTILLSWESIFGELGVLEKPKYRRMGLYRNASARTNRLIKGLGESLQSRTMDWVVLFATRDRETFLRSCHNQLLKAGNNIESNFDTFKKTVNFTYADPDKLKKNITKLRTKQKVTKPKEII